MLWHASGQLLGISFHPPFIEEGSPLGTAVELAFVLLGSSGSASHLVTGRRRPQIDVICGFSHGTWEIISGPLAHMTKQPFSELSNLISRKIYSSNTSSQKCLKARTIMGKETD